MLPEKVKIPTRKELVPGPLARPERGPNCGCLWFHAIQIDGPRGRRLHNAIDAEALNEYARQKDHTEDGLITSVLGRDTPTNLTRAQNVFRAALRRVGYVIRGRYAYLKKAKRA